ncbi:hypothetical protein ACFPOE_22650 [Caenimonas terrae]|uniref:Uncharacterized protein n=1 Tax=Caenimonas terrae TaxID=696074 RepID=A0ABW0NI89_9BURK
METQILYAAEAEQLSLEKQLAKLDSEYKAKRKPILERLEAVKMLRLAYGIDYRVGRQPEMFESGAHPEQAIPTPRENSHKARVLSAAMALLADGVSMKTPLLLEKMEARGIEFQAKDKQGNLSVILSKDPRFVSDRRTGWSLAQKNQQDAATSAGSLPT